MKKFLLLAFILLVFTNTNAQQVSFSDSSVVSLITCSPGKEIYAKFGHTAIRINDQVNGNDYVFNYGIFNFNTSNFYFKFIKGETDYQLGAYETAYFLPEYKQRNSNVTEQILNMTVPEKRKLINYLLFNFQPENRIYRYNFIFDNCATRPRDRIFGALDGYVRFENHNESKTFRQWVGNYVGTDTWLKFGIDLIFGIDADREATKSESMFLPEILMANIQTSFITNKKNETRKLVSERKILNSKDESLEGNESSCFFKPLTVSLILLVIGIFITFWDIYRKRHSKWFDSALLITTGLAGFIVFFLMFFSTHPLVKSNLNLLWLNPLNVILGVLLWIRNVKVRRTIFFYEIFNMVLYIGALFAFALSAQSFNLACFPLIVLLLLRSTRWFAYTKHKLYKHSLIYHFNRE